VKQVLFIFLILISLKVLALCEKATTYQVGRVQYLELNESSGLAWSPVDSGTLWSHNDSGGRPYLYSMKLNGDKKGIFEIQNAKNKDWEDIERAPCPYNHHDHCLYIADFGNNKLKRRKFQIYIVKEPVVFNSKSITKIPLLKKLVIKLPTAPLNFEAIAYHPKEKRFYIVSKGTKYTDDQGISHIYEFNPFTHEHQVDLMKMTTLNLLRDKTFKDLPENYLWFTAGDIADSGSHLLLLSEGHAYLYQWNKLKKAHLNSPQIIELPKLPQKESISFGLHAKQIYLTSEGRYQPIYALHCQ